MRELNIKTKYDDYTFDELRKLSHTKYLLNLKLRQGIPFLKKYDGIGDENTIDDE